MALKNVKKEKYRCVVRIVLGRTDPYSKLTAGGVHTKKAVNNGNKCENYSGRFPEGSKKRKPNNDDKHGHGQETRRPSTYVEGKKNIKYALGFDIDFDGFCINLWKVFLLMYLPFSRPIYENISYRFYFGWGFPSFSANTRRPVFYCVNRMILVHAPFSENSIFMRSNSENYRNAGLFSYHCSSIFITFSESISVSICSLFFDGRWLPKWIVA